MADPLFIFKSINPFGLSGTSSMANPTLVDIDNDGDLDAFVGNNVGNTLFYRNTGTANNPVFAAAVANPFGLTDVGYGADPTFVDIDSDGDLDAFVGSYSGNTLFYKNTGTANNPVFAAAVSNPFGLNDVGSFAQPTFVDIDGDGDLDAFVGNYDGYTSFFRNTGTANNPVFAAPETDPFGLMTRSPFGHNAKSTFVDIDGDGDLDAFIGVGNYAYGGAGQVVFFRNIGTTNNPTFYRDSVNPFGLSNAGASESPTFADIDDDGDLDALIGNIQGDTFFFQNSGIGSSPSFSVSSSAFNLSGVGSNPAATFVDIDNDGDLDAFMGNADGNTQFFRNTGTAHSPVFAVPQINPFGLSDVGSFANPAFVDIDNDGDLDAFVGNNSGDTLFYKNTGTSNNPVFAAAVANPFGLSGVDNFADIDGDGDLDVFAGNADGNTQFFQNTGTIVNGGVKRYQIAREKCAS